MIFCCTCSQPVRLSHCASLRAVALMSELGGQADLAAIASIGRS
jgi:hypothetical protein